MTAETRLETGQSTAASAIQIAEGKTNGAINPSGNTSEAVSKHPVYTEAIVFVRQMEAGGTVHVQGVERLPSGFRNYHTKR